MAELLIGLDVGTTATKALLFDADGRLLASASRPYGLITTRPGWVEQDTEEIWRAVVAVLQELARQAGRDHQIVALSLSSQGGTTIPADAAGRPLRRAFSWMDERSAEEAAEVEARWGAEFIRMTSGWPLLGGLPLQHIRWLRHRDPAEFAAARRYLFVNDFIGYRLTGQFCMNPSDAGITQLMSLATGDWDARLLDIAGISREQLSVIRPSGEAVGRLARGVADATGLNPEVLLVNGAHDQYCAAVGTGVTRPGRMLLSCGTAWVLLAVPPSMEAGLASGMAISRHAIAGRWGAIRSLGGVGSSLEWLVDNACGTPMAEGGGATTSAGRQVLYARLSEAAARTPPGADGLLFLPLAGGHAAGFGPGRGGFLNLSLGHTRGHLVRAVMEGTAFELRWAAEEMRTAGIEVVELIMVGGATRSPIWPQIVTDVLGIPVTVPAVKDAAARGAAILAGVGAGLLPDAEAGLAAWGVGKQRLETAPEHRHELDRAYAEYRGLIETLATVRRSDPEGGRR